jgi:type I restriction enzyme S subunit
MSSERKSIRFGDLLASEGTRNGIYKSKEFHGRGAKIVNMGELFAYPRLFDVEMKRVDINSGEEEKYSLKTGDLLFARRSLVAEGAGKCSIVKEVEGATVFESSIIRARVDAIKADSEYLYYTFSSVVGRNLLGTILRQTAVSGITGTDLVELEIPLPPVAEQKAIAHILGTLDEKIELNRKTNETLEAMAKALFKSWFVDFDPVRAKAEGRPTGLPAEISDLFPDSFEDSELGEIPSGWKVMELGMVSTFLNGYAFKSSDWQEHGVPVVKIGSVKPGFVDVVNVSFVSDEIAVSKDRYRLSPGDILIGMTGYVGEVGLVPISESPPLLNQRVGKVAPMSDAIVSRSFLYNWMRTSTFKDSVEVLSHGSAQANVSSDSIQSIPHAIPSSDIESAFASICEPILDRLLEGHREQKLLANTRDALLPKLISGEIRIPDAEKMLEEVEI